MTKPIMSKVNNKFESLEAFENTAQLAAKNQRFAFSKKDSNLTRHNKKFLFVVLQCTKGEDGTTIGILQRRLIRERKRLDIRIFLCLSKVFISDRDQALRNALSKVFLILDKILCLASFGTKLKSQLLKTFKTDNKYEVFKKKFEALQFTKIEEEIS
ncbi:14083_t:CDS:2 [Cetraspora pellucida]|uniref:14083_t:CDS:1 n=1 Tax=Cetraspora pellucida TaxID=1433469 RepID=A0A9N9N601_9GLOM|nr:14083_t:CDS:2 [Cetraspora pellucida]